MVIKANLSFIAGFKKTTF